MAIRAGTFIIEVKKIKSIFMLFNLMIKCLARGQTAESSDNKPQDSAKIKGFSKQMFH